MVFIQDTMIEQLKRCNASKHKTIEIYRVDVDEFTEHVIRWCEECGCVGIYQMIDGRYACKLADLHIPRVAIEYWNEKYDGYTGSPKSEETR